MTDLSDEVSNKLFPAKTTNHKHRHSALRLEKALAAPILWDHCSAIRTTRAAGSLPEVKFRVQVAAPVVERRDRGRVGDVDAVAVLKPVCDAALYEGVCGTVGIFVGAPLDRVAAEEAAGEGLSRSVICEPSSRHWGVVRGSGCHVEMDNVVGERFRSQ